MKKVKNLFSSFSFGKKNKEQDNNSQNDNSSRVESQYSDHEAGQNNSYVGQSYKTQLSQTSQDEVPSQNKQTAPQSMTDIQSLAARSIRVTFPKHGNQEEHDKNLQSLLNTLPGIINVKFLFGYSIKFLLIYLLVVYLFSRLA